MGGVVSRIDTVLRRMEAQEKGREEKGAIMDDFFDPGRRESDLVGVDLYIYILNHVCGQLKWFWMGFFGAEAEQAKKKQH